MLISFPRTASSSFWESSARFFPLKENFARRNFLMLFQQSQNRQGCLGFPELDSPTMPSISPSFMAKETSFTTSRGLCIVKFQPQMSDFQQAHIISRLSLKVHHLKEKIQEPADQNTKPRKNGAPWSAHKIRLGF